MKDLNAVILSARLTGRAGNEGSPSDEKQNANNVLPKIGGVSGQVG